MEYCAYVVGNDNGFSITLYNDATEAAETLMWLDSISMANAFSTMPIHGDNSTESL